MNGKVIIITGASTGIGAELARQLAAQGAKIALAARNKDKLNEVAKDCPDSIVIPTDVTDPTQCQHLIDQTVEHYGRLDVLVNNAGRTMWALFEEIDDFDIYHQIMQLNYFGSVYCTKAALPHLKQSKGLITVISSLAGKTGVPTRTGYAASKHALVGFFDSLRIELMDTGVDVTLIYPGFVVSEIHKRAFGADGQPLGESPMQEDKIMTTAECARLIADAMKKRKRDVIMTTRGKIGMWLKLLMPSRIDKIAQKAIQDRQ